MKFLVSSLLIFLLFFACLFAVKFENNAAKDDGSELLASVSIFSNTVQCIDPPGGSVTCEDDQIAVCIVTNGEANGQCIDVEDNLNGRRLAANILGQIEGVSVNADLVQSLIDGDRRLATNIGIVTLSIPEEIKDRIDE